MEVLKWILLIIGSYLIGNISFARLLSKLKKQDITKSGSGNPGTMNMLRTYGIAYGLLTLALDLVKGVIPALVGKLLFGWNTEMATIGLLVGGLCVVVGHIYPVLYKFKGGKGVACVLGVFLVANPIWVVIFLAVDIVYLWFFNYGSVGSLMMVSALVVMESIKPQNNTNLTINLLLFGIFGLIWFAHRSNILRLLLGTENKVNLQKSLQKSLNKIEKKEIKEEYKQNKEQILNEYKELKKELKHDVNLKKKKYKLEKKMMNKKIKLSQNDLLIKNIKEEAEVKNPKKRKKN